MDTRRWLEVNPTLEPWLLHNSGASLSQPFDRGYFCKTCHARFLGHQSTAIRTTAVTATSLHVSIEGQPANADEDRDPQCRESVLASHSMASKGQLFVLRPKIELCQRRANLSKEHQRIPVMLARGSLTSTTTVLVAGQLSDAIVNSSIQTKIAGHFVSLDARRQSQNTSEATSCCPRPFSLDATSINSHLSISQDKSTVRHCYVLRGPLAITFLDSSLHSQLRDLPVSVRG